MTEELGLTIFAAVAGLVGIPWRPMLGLLAVAGIAVAIWYPFIFSTVLEAAGLPYVAPWWLGLATATLWGCGLSGAFVAGRGIHQEIARRVNGGHE